MNRLSFSRRHCLELKRSFLNFYLKVDEQNQLNYLDLIFGARQNYMAMWLL